MDIQSSPGLTRPKSRQPRPPSARIMFRGRVFQVWQWDQTLFDGTTAVFETLSRPDTVLVIPVLGGDQVVLAEETQPGMDPVLHALGGGIKPGEPPEKAAARELLEESGYAAAEFRLWDAWQPVDKIDWAVYLYVAHGIIGQPTPASNPGERIALRTLPAAALLAGDLEHRLDDQELLQKIWFARYNLREEQRVRRLLDPQAFPG